MISLGEAVKERGCCLLRSIRLLFLHQIDDTANFFVPLPPSLSTSLSSFFSPVSSSLAGVAIDLEDSVSGCLHRMVKLLPVPHGDIEVTLPMQHHRGKVAQASQCAACIELKHQAGAQYGHGKWQGPEDETGGVVEDDLGDRCEGRFQH